MTASTRTSEWSGLLDMIGAALGAIGVDEDGNPSTLAATIDDDYEREQLLSATSGYIVEKSPMSSARTLRSAPEEGRANVVVARAHELMFLQMVDALPERLEPGCAFRVLPTSTVEDLERDEHERELLDGFNILLDTRELGVFVPTSGSSRSYAYTGDISNKRAAAAHKIVLCSEARAALSKLLSGDSERRNYFDMPCNIAEDIANELFCGKARIAIAKKKTKGLSAAIAKFDLMPATNPQICDETRLLNLIPDAAKVWSGYVRMMGKQSLPEAIGVDHREKWNMPSSGTLRSWFERFRAESGVETGMDALFAGVPADDIVS